MACDRYWELLSARADGASYQEEERELEEHLAVCPDCRAAGAQLAALRAAFDDWEEVSAPEGFASGVMDRIRRTPEAKTTPLFRRPQFRALAGLAACAVLAVGLYGVGRSQQQDPWDEVSDSFVQDVSEGAVDDASGRMRDRCAPADGDVPLIAAYAADDYDNGGTGEGDPADGLRDVQPILELEPAARWADGAILVLDRMPQGVEALIGPEVAVSYNPATGEESYDWYMTEGEPEVLAQIEQLAIEQEIVSERPDRTGEEPQWDLVVLGTND